MLTINSPQHAQHKILHECMHDVDYMHSISCFVLPYSCVYTHRCIYMGISHNGGLTRKPPNMNMVLFIETLKKKPPAD